MHYKIELEGVTALVMNNWENMGAAVTTPEKESELTCYRKKPEGKFKKGELYIPARCLMASLLYVAAPFSLKLSGKKVKVKKWIAGGCVIDPEQVGLGVEKYEIWKTAYVIMGKRIIKGHARIFPWSVNFHLVFSTAHSTFNDIAVSLKGIMSEMWTLAGIQAGVLDNRPGSPKKPGPHGTFKLKKCELME